MTAAMEDHAMRASAHIIGRVFPEQRPRLSRLTRPHLIAGSLFVCTLIVIGVVGARGRSAPPPLTALPSTVSPAPSLRICRTRVERDHGYVVVQGEATNLTSH